jgi:hypothetical protein
MRVHEASWLGCAIVMPTFVLIGHCGPDSFLLRNAVRRAVPGATIAVADDDQALRPHLQRDRVLLVNRVLDGSFGAESGIELIAKLAGYAPAPVMMLVSNYADAQDIAVAVGAVRGFGKRDVNSAHTAELLAAAARAATEPQSLANPTTD